MSKSIFVCQNCASEHRKWAGQCPDCNEWNCVVEQSETPITARVGTKGKALHATSITEISSEDNPRRSTGVEELDRVLGGGLVPGSAVLIGGDPGIGKSTLLLQASSNLAALGELNGKNMLYITGEESTAQVKMRGERISSLHKELMLIAGSELESIMATISKNKPIAVVIDSIQTMMTNRLTSAPGTVSQVRDCAAALIQQAKQLGHSLILVGHVTKDGSIAGPRVLEHMVDAVLYFEGDKGHTHRILRAVKNRFGPAGEIGVFEMSDRGLIGIRDASKLFLAERALDVPGSAVLACMEGTRPLLVEVQALVAPTVYSTPKRSSVGLDINRIGMLAAVLERRIGIPLGQFDIYVNVAGGAKINEPAADLAVLLAIISSYQEKPLPANLALFGEVGLTGEIRPVGNPEARAREAANLGFSQLLLPRENETRVQESNLAATLRKSAAGLTCLPAKHLSEAVQIALV
jgi:DNA repair protein RadA/Sms